MDRLRIVTIPANGRPFVVRDLNNGTNVSLIRDTIKFTPPTSNTITNASGRRFDGERAVQESHSNAQVYVEWWVGDGVMGQTAALELAEQLSKQIADVTSGYLIEWRPDGASTSVYLETRGAGSYSMSWRWVEWQGTQRIHLLATWNVAPLALGDQTWVYDDFLRPERLGTPSVTNQGLDDYQQVVGSGTSYIDANTRLQFTTAALKTYLHTARGYKFNSVELTYRLQFSATATTGTFHDLIVSYIDANNYVFARWDNVLGTVTISKVVAGATTALTTNTTTAATTTGTYWFRARKIGNLITADVFPVATPTSRDFPGRLAVGGTSLTTSFTLLTTDAALFSAPTYSGFRVTPPATSTNLIGLAFFIEPFPAGVSANTYTTALGSGQNFGVAPGNLADTDIVPGTAPALVDIDVAFDTTAASSSYLQWAMLAWWAKGSPSFDYAGTGTQYAPFGMWDSDSATNYQFTSFPNTISSAEVGGGTMWGANSVSGAITYDWFAYLDPSAVVPDDFTGEIRVELWTKLYQSGGLTSLTAVASARPNSAAFSERYTSEWGTAGKILPIGAGRTLHRLGVITMPIDTTSSDLWQLHLALTTGGGSSGSFGLDWVAGVPARSRATLPTSKPVDSNYPSFHGPSGSRQMTRRIKSDLTGQAIPYAQRPNRVSAARGMTGSQITLPGGTVPQLLVVASDLVPDDPTLPAGEGTGIAALKFYTNLRVQPRYFLLRGSS